MTHGAAQAGLEPRLTPRVPPVLSTPSLAVAHYISSFDVSLPVLVPSRMPTYAGMTSLAKVPLQQIDVNSRGEKDRHPALSRPGEGRGARPVLKAQRIGIGGLGGVSVTV